MTDSVAGVLADGKAGSTNPKRNATSWFLLQE